MATKSLAGSSPPDDLVVLGRIVGSYGVKGWIRVQPFENASASNLLKSKGWWLIPRDAADAMGSELAKLATRFEVMQSKAHSNDIVAQHADINLLEAAQALAGSRIAVSRKEFAAITGQEYYWVDLIGCSVRNREKIELGAVTAVDDYGAHAILAIEQLANLQTDQQGTQGSEVLRKSTTKAPLLIPFVAAYIDEVSLVDRLVLVDWPVDWQVDSKDDQP